MVGVTRGVHLSRRSASVRTEVKDVLTRADPSIWVTPGLRFLMAQNNPTRELPTPRKPLESRDAFA
jgi:hypothetical protein